jgi:hypothetical protein
MAHIYENKTNYTQGYNSLRQRIHRRNDLSVMSLTARFHSNQTLYQ